MVGLGVGNLLGVPQEGWPRHAVEASYPNGIREIELEPGEPDDDDLAQAIILAEAAIEAGSGDLDTDGIGRRFRVWAEENGRGIGIQTADVLSLIGGARPRCGLGFGLQAREPRGLPALEAARQVWEESGRYSAGNGAVIPLALGGWRRSDRAARRWKCSLTGALQLAGEGRQVRPAGPKKRRQLIARPVQTRTATPRDTTPAIVCPTTPYTSPVWANRSQRRILKPRVKVG